MPSYCVYIPSFLFFSIFLIGCFPQSVLRKQVMLCARVWLQSTDQKRNVMEGHHFFYYSSCAVTHCHWVKKRNSALRLIGQSRAAKTRSSKLFLTATAMATMQQWSFSTSKKTKKQKRTFTSQNRQKASHAMCIVKPLGLLPVNKCIWCLVLSQQACLHERMPSRRAELYSPAEHCVNAVPPLMSQRIMNMTLKL